MSTKKCNSENKNSIQLFYYEGLSVRTLNFDGDIWFVAKDVADILGYTHTPTATRLLDDDEKALFNSRDNSVLFWHSIQEGEDNTTLNWSSIQEENKPTNCRLIQEDEETRTQKRGNPNIIIISEPGLYELVLRSNKPEAREFSRWVRHDVLPQIRKTGSFSISEKKHDEAERQTTRQVINQQCILNQRINFWKSVNKAAAPLFEILLSTEQYHVYIVPESIKKNDVDNNEIHLLRSWLIPVKDFINSKISQLEHKSNLIKKIIDD